MLDLQELEAIKQLKYKYIRCIDEKRWDEMKECFDENATVAFSGGKYAFAGRDAIMKFMVDSMDRDAFHSSHRVHQPEIEFTSETTATGTWALEDTVIDTQFEITLRGAAFYRDEYVKIDGRWKIRSTGYERTFEEIESRKANPNLTLTQSRWQAV
jgi:bile-acid 7alpha-dehydratase